MTSFRIRTLLDGPAPPPHRLLGALPPGSRPVLLDSSDGRGWSLLAWAPDRSVEVRMAPAAGHLPRGGGPASRWPLADADPAARLAAALAVEEWDRDDPEPPLAGGWLGYFGFECGHAWEPFPWLRPEPGGLPDASLARYRRAIAWDPAGRARLLWAEPQGTPTQSRLERAGVETEFRRLLTAPPSAAGDGELPRLPQPGVAAEEFRERVLMVRERIGAGELYQANLSHGLEGPAPRSPRALYARGRRSQPTAMSAYWEDGRGRALLSWSPEQFLSVRGSRLATRPIKGTAALPERPEQEARAAAALEASEKEVAELTMIVDMARHDLGRLAPPGGVQVVSPGVVERYPTLLHRTATVQASWDPAAGPAPLFKATFPPASVTGAPKVAALQAIAELEGEPRGPYCGCLGGWEPGEPRADFSVLIRTAVVASGRLSMRVGAGIVWDSDPQKEWEETLLKARFLEGALGAVPSHRQRNSHEDPPA